MASLLTKSSFNYINFNKLSKHYSHLPITTLSCRFVHKYQRKPYYNFETQIYIANNDLENVEYNESSALANQSPFYSSISSAHLHKVPSYLHKVPAHYPHSRTHFTDVLGRVSNIFTTKTLAGINLSQTRNISSSPPAMNQNGEAKAKFTPPDNLGTKVTEAEVKRFMIDCMTSVGANAEHSAELADVLIAGDKRGHFSHGLNRLEMYVTDVKNKICDGGALPVIEKESVSTALINGNNGLGPVVGNFCTNLAIKKAKETGIGWVCARGSNHYGIAGWYAMMASKQGLLGMSFTNTSPLVAPTRAKKGCLGTNPIALAAPAEGEDEFVLDMATCTVALGKVEIQRRKEEPIPEGWAIDSTGEVTTDATKAMLGGALMPLGGSEVNSGYKGYGLAMLVEVFCGLLSGATYGPNVRSWMNTEREADLGQCFVAIDPSFFAPGFPGRMTDLMDHCRNMEPADAEKPVMVPGDPERKHIQKIEEEGGITYHINQIKDSWQFAKFLDVEPMKST